MNTLSAVVRHTVWRRLFGQLDSLPKRAPLSTSSALTRRIEATVPRATMLARETTVKRMGVRRMGVRRIDLNVSGDHAALHLYQSLGYQVPGMGEPIWTATPT